MRTITLTQPWASLVAIGAKTIETRNWYTPHRGPLAIHAAKGYPDWAAAFTDDLEHVSAEEYGFELPLLPFGEIVAICRLVDCLPTNRPDRIPGLTSQERDFGDFTHGRFAWVLADIEALPRSIPARGALGLWDWDEGSPIAMPRPVQRQMRLEL